MPDSALVSVDDSDGEIDLNPYLKILAKHLMFILGIALVAAMIGAGTALRAPKSYAAQALIAITPPLYVLNVDPRTQPGQDPSVAQKTAQISRAMTSLALEDDVLKSLIASSPTAIPPEAKSIEDLRASLSVESGSDPSLLLLNVRVGDPQKAAVLANAWAEALVTRAQSVYGGNVGDLSYLQGTIDAASTNLDKAQTALANFEARSQISVLSAQLTTLKQDQQSYLADREAIIRLTTDVQGLSRHLDQYPPTEKVSLSDDLTALLLETKAFNATTTNATTTVPVQLQVSSADGVSTKTAADLKGVLGDLESQLKTRSDSDQTRIDLMTPQILQLQGQIQQISNQEDRLIMDRDSAKATYQSLVQQSGEVRFSTQSANAQIRLGGQAAPPSRALPSHATTNGIAAGAIGLLLGVIVVFIWDWRRTRKSAGTEPLPNLESARAATIAGADGADD